MEQQASYQYSGYDVGKEDEAEEIGGEQVAASSQEFKWTDQMRQDYASKKELLQQISNQSARMAQIIKKLRREGRLMSIEEALKEEPDVNKPKEDLPVNFAMGAVAKTFGDLGMENVAIAKDDLKDIKDLNEVNLAANQMMINADMCIAQEEHDLEFDLGEERNEELRNDPKKREEFINQMRKEMSLKTGIPENEIFFLDPFEEEEEEDDK